jgi:hypothetical protein
VVPGSLRRWRIRRLYNRQQFAHARQLSEDELGGKNHAFALDIIVRSLYNEGHWERLLAVFEDHPETDYEVYVQKAQRRLNQAREEAEGVPEPEDKKPWDVSDLLSNWTQEGDRLWLRHPWGWTHWDMPEGFSLSETHPALLHLALEVLLFPWVPETKQWDVEQRVTGTKHSLSYSGGVDSTAAMLLLPEDTILAYHERNFTSMLNHSLPHSIFDAITERNGRKVLCIPSNHEKIRTHHGLQTGFSSANAACVHLILLADHLDLCSISFGTVIENTWLKKGLKFRDFRDTHYWRYWPKQFKKAGLAYVLPTNHISEAGALKICNQSPFSDVVNSCLRGRGGRWCGTCWKCFHKNGPLGRAIDPTSNEISIFLNKKPLRTAQHALWALKVQGLEHLAPHLKEHIAEDLSWWDKAYEPGLNLIEEPLRSVVKDKTDSYLEWMAEPYALVMVDLDV